MSYLKDKYKTIELSHYEIQMLHAILDDKIHHQNFFYTETNLKELREMFTRIANQLWG